MSKFKFTLLFAILIILGFGLYWGRSSWRNWLATQPRISNELEALQESDEELLEKFLSGQTIDELKIYPVLYRLAESVKAESLPLRKAIEQAQASVSSRLRQAAMRASGQRGEAWALEILRKGFEDIDAEVRLTAIDSIKNSSLREHRKVLENHLSWLESNKISEASADKAFDREGELGATLSALVEMLKTDKSGEAGRGYLQRLKELSSKTLGSRGGTSSLALQKLIEVTEDPNLLLSKLDQLLKKSKLEEGFERAAASAILKLANLQDKTLASRLLKLSQHPDAIVRRAVLQSLHRLCPPDVWQIAERSLQTEKDPNNLIAAVEAIALLERSRAIQVLEALKREGSTTSNSANPAREALRVRASALLEELRQRSPTGGACGEDTAQRTGAFTK